MHGSGAFDVIIDLRGFFGNMLHLSIMSESIALQYDQVSSLLDLNVAMTQSLLQASKWDKEKLIDNFFGN